jgi:hypothetical protein
MDTTAHDAPRRCRRCGRPLAHVSSWARCDVFECTGCGQSASVPRAPHITAAPEAGHPGAALTRAVLAAQKVTAAQGAFRDAIGHALAAGVDPIELARACGAPLYHTATSGDAA